MARPQRCRRICSLPGYTYFEPVGSPACDGGTVALSLDEFEALRLMDYEGCTHEQCASVMQISRTTATEIYASARKKLAEAIIDGRPLIIGGGSVRLCDRTDSCGQNVCPACGQALSQENG